MRRSAETRRSARRCYEESGYVYATGAMEIAQRSSSVVVMSGKAVELLKDIYAVPQERIEFILHGTPDFPS
jgi:hypothetical protein